MNPIQPSSSVGVMLWRGNLPVGVFSSLPVYLRQHANPRHDIGIHPPSVTILEPRIAQHGVVHV